MGTLVKSAIPILFSCLGLLSCAKNLPTLHTQPAPNSPEKPFGDEIVFAEGQLLLDDSSVRQLGSNILKPQVLIFSQDTCLVCRSEATALVEHLTPYGGAPQNVELITVLVGGIVEDAQDFKQALGIQWRTAVQPQDALFRKFCPELKVPCLIIQKPEEGIIYRVVGEFSIEKLKAQTGPWSYR